MTASLGALLPFLLPGLVMIVAGMVLLGLRGAIRDIVILAAPLAVLALIWGLPDGAAGGIHWLGYELVPFRSDALSRLFGTIFSLMAFAGGLFALRQERLAEVPVAFMYAGSAIGVVFAGDLITVFVFWEVMAVCSTLVIWMAGAGARGAGQRYIVMHLFGGVVLMAGIAGHIADTGSIAFGPMLADTPAHWLILAGFLLNAGSWPVSAWLPDAYPKASWSGTVFLSAFTTKTAVFVLLRGFPGEEVLIWVGMVMVFYGIIYAILENDMRRILAYSIVNQIGFILVAIGIGSEMALNGAAAHAFIHIIYKGLLLMAAGSVMYVAGRTKCTELGGLFRTMPLTTACAIVGALAMSAMPLTSGFVTKSMISDSAKIDGMAAVWFLLMAASAALPIMAGIKFPWFVFFQKDSGLRPPDPPWTMRLAMILMAILCIGIGVFPAPLYAMLPFPVDFVPYTTSHVVSQLLLLLFAGLAFFVLLRWLKPTDTITLDVDWLWRRLGPSVIARMDRQSAGGAMMNRGQRAATRALQAVYRHHGPTGILARSWPTGSMAFWAVLMLSAYLVFYYL